MSASAPVNRPSPSIRLRRVLGVLAAVPASKTLWSIALLTFVLRAVVAIWGPETKLQPDCAEYEQLAQELLDHQNFGFGTDWQRRPELVSSPWSYQYEATGSMLRPPGYPLVLAGTRAVFGASRLAPRLVLSAVDAAAAAAVTGLAVAVLGATGGWVAGLLYVASPAATYAITVDGREPLLTLTFAAGLLATLTAYRRRSPLLAAVAGLAFGLGGNVKETVVFSGAIAGLWLVAKTWRTPRLALAMAGGALAVMAPFWLRNLAVRGALVGFTSMSGLALSLGFDLDPWLAQQSVQFLAETDPYTAGNAVAADQRLKQRTLAYVRDRPGPAARAMARNIAAFWSPVPMQVVQTGNWTPLTGALGLYYLSVFVAAAMGLRALAGRPEALLFAWVLLGVTAMHAITTSWPRYRTPFEPILLILAAFTLAKWAQAPGRPADGGRS